MAERRVMLCFHKRSSFLLTVRVSFRTGSQTLPLRRVWLKLLKFQVLVVLLLDVIAPLTDLVGLTTGDRAGKVDFELPAF